MRPPFALSFSPYLLRSLGRPRDRRGALLRVESDAGTGYADLHPWPELGDAPLDETLAGLVDGRPTRLARRALAIADEDARARRAGRSLFEGHPAPRSHFHAIDDCVATILRARDAGFTRVKLKVTGDDAVTRLAAWADALDERVSFRLDLNGALDAASFVVMLERMGRLRDRLDFIEDPVADWHTLPVTVPVALARDRAADDAGRATVRVIKPAIDDPRAPVSGASRVVLTSYLDHPLGQAAAALEAARFARPPGEVDGLLSHFAYAPEAFAEALRHDGPLFLPPEGTGLGFDTLLERTAWTRLC